MSPYAKNQKTSRGSQMKRLSIGDTHEMTQILELSDKNFKEANCNCASWYKCKHSGNN